MPLELRADHDLHPTDRITPAGLTGPPGVLGAGVPALDLDRAAGDAVERTAGVVRALAVDGLPGAGAPVGEVWATLAAIARADLAVARLAEGHVDARRILHEAGRTPAPGAVYGVWASASGGTGLTGTARRPEGAQGAGERDGWRVDGTMRYCSGAWFIDRALVVIDTDGGKRLVDVDVRAARAPGGSITSQESTWPAVGMDVTRSVDLEVRSLPVAPADVVGEPGFYLDRRGFSVGGVGVAAVWLGGAAGVLDALVRALPRARANAHQLAHLGAMAVAVTSADALLGELAARPDPESIGPADATAARTAVELAAQVVLDRAPRVSGPTPLCRDAAFAHRMADLQVYLRQHHAEKDYEQLGDAVLTAGTLLGRDFR